MSQPPPNKSDVLLIHPESGESGFYLKPGTLTDIQSLQILPRGLHELFPVTTNRLSSIFDPISTPDPSCAESDPLSNISKELTSLKTLLLSGLPLYTSIRNNIKTLTKIEIIHDAFPNTPETILAVLKCNPSLKTVWLYIGFEPSFRNLTEANLEHQIKLDQLESLRVHGCSQEDLEQLINLVPRISLPRNALVDVGISGPVFKNEKLNLNFALSSIGSFTTPPTRLWIDYSLPDQNIRFPGPNESKIVVSRVPDLEITSTLTEMLPPLFERVKVLHITVANRNPDDRCDLQSPQLNPLLFPTLETLTIAQGRHIATTLSKILSSQKQPSLKKLEIKNCNVVEGFEGVLEAFASKWGYDVSPTNSDAITCTSYSISKSFGDMTTQPDL